MPDFIEIRDQIIPPEAWRALRLSYAIAIMAYSEPNHVLRLTEADLLALPLGRLAMDEEPESTVFRYRADPSANLILDQNELVVAVLTHKSGGALRIEHSDLNKMPDGHVLALFDETADSDDLVFLWRAGMAPADAEAL